MIGELMLRQLLVYIWLECNRITAEMEARNSVCYTLRP